MLDPQGNGSLHLYAEADRKHFACDHVDCGHYGLILFLSLHFSMIHWQLICAIYSCRRNLSWPHLTYYRISKLSFACFFNILMMIIVNDCCWGHQCYLFQELLWFYYVISVMEKRYLWCFCVCLALCNSSLYIASIQFPHTSWSGQLLPYDLFLSSLCSSNHLMYTKLIVVN